LSSLIGVGIAAAGTFVAGDLQAPLGDGIASVHIERAVQEPEARVRKQHPEVVALYVTPQTPQTFRNRAPTG